MLGTAWICFALMPILLLCSPSPGTYVEFLFSSPVICGALSNAACFCEVQVHVADHCQVFSSESEQRCKFDSAIAPGAGSGFMQRRVTSGVHLARIELVSNSFLSHSHQASEVTKFTWLLSSLKHCRRLTKQFLDCIKDPREG